MVGKMSMCDLCGEYSDCLHPISFVSEVSALIHKLDIDMDKLRELREWELRKHIEEWDGYYDSEGFPTYLSSISGCPYICHKCFEKYVRYIVWWG